MQFNSNGNRGAGWRAACAGMLIVGCAFVVVAALGSDDSGMATCQARHSFDTCFHALMR